MSKNVTKNHHLVSQVLLRQWFDRRSNKHVVSRYDISKKEIEHIGTKGISWKYERVHPSDPVGFEDKWQKVETDTGIILKGFSTGNDLLTNNSETVIKNLMAIHLVRSIAYVENLRKRFFDSIESCDPSYVPWLMKMTDYQKLLKLELAEGPFYTKNMLILYPIVKNYLAPKRCKLYLIPSTLEKSTFLIGDCPVLPLTVVNGLPAITEGQIFGPSVATYAFPISPKLYVQISKYARDSKCDIRGGGVT